MSELNYTQAFEELQAIVGEMSVDEAFTKIDADMTDAVKQAQK